MAVSQKELVRRLYHRESRVRPRARADLSVRNYSGYQGVRIFGTHNKLDLAFRAPIDYIPSRMEERIWR